MSNKATGKYYVTHTNGWCIICPDGWLLYDNAPYGKDKPVRFTCEDDAEDCVERLNAALSELESDP